MTGDESRSPHLGECVGLDHSGDRRVDEALYALHGRLAEQVERRRRGGRQVQALHAVDDVVRDALDVDGRVDGGGSLVDHQLLHIGIVGEGAEGLHERVLAHEFRPCPRAEDGDGHQDAGEHDADGRDERTPPSGATSAV